MKNTDIYSKNSTYLTQNAIDSISDAYSKFKNLTLVFKPGIGRTAVSKDLENGNLVVNGTESTLFISLDLVLENDFFIHFLEQSVLQYSNKTNLFEALEEVSQDKSIIFLLRNASKKSTAQLKYMAALTEKFGNISSWLLVYKKDFNEIKLTDIHTKYLNQIVSIDYLNYEESLEWLRQNSKKTNITLSDSRLAEIADYCGGVNSILRKCLLANENEVLSDVEEVQKTIISVWKRTDEKTKENYISSTTKPGWVRDVLQDFEVYILTLEGNTLTWGNINVSQKLGVKENEVLIGLLKSENNYLSREEIYNLVWGEDNTKIRTEWALDKFVSRLKAKLMQVGIRKSSIKAVKGLGYKLQNVELG